MRIVNPSFGTTPNTTEVLQSDKPDWTRDPILLFGNSKPNSRELLEGVGSKLAAMRAGGEIAYHSKPSASVAASPGMLDRMASQYRLAVIALGD